MKCQSLGRFGSDSRKMGKLLNQFIDMAAVIFHQKEDLRQDRQGLLSVWTSLLILLGLLRSASFVAAAIMILKHLDIIRIYRFLRKV